MTARVHKGALAVSTRAAPLSGVQCSTDVWVDRVLRAAQGDPNDRKALLAHRRMIDESRAKLEREKAAWDKKQSMLKRQAAAKATAVSVTTLPRTVTPLGTTPYVNEDDTAPARERVLTPGCHPVSLESLAPQLHPSTWATECTTYLAELRCRHC